MQNERIEAIKKSISTFFHNQDDIISNVTHRIGLIQSQGHPAILSSQQRKALLKDEEVIDKIGPDAEEFKNFIENIVIFSAVTDSEKYRNSIYHKFQTLSRKLHPGKENQFTEYYKYNCGHVRKNLLLHSNLKDIFTNFPSEPPLLSEEQFSKMSSEFAKTLISMFKSASTSNTTKLTVKETPKENIWQKVVVYQIPDDWWQVTNNNSNNQTNLDFVKKLLFIKIKFNGPKNEEVLQKLKKAITSIAGQHSITQKDLWNRYGCLSSGFLIITQDIFSLLSLASNLSSNIQSFDDTEILKILADESIITSLEIMKNSDKSISKNQETRELRRKRLREREETEEELPLPEEPSQPSPQSSPQPMVVEANVSVPAQTLTPSATASISREMASMFSLISETFTMSLQNLENEVKELKQENNELQKEMKILTDEALQKEQSYEKQIAQLQTDIKETDKKEIKNLESVNQKLNATIATLNTKVQEQQNSINGYVKEKDMLQQTISRLESQLSDVNKAIEGLKTVNDSKENNIQALLKAGEELNAELAKQSNENKELLTTLQSGLYEQRDTTSRQMTSISLLVALFLRNNPHIIQGLLPSFISPTTQPSSPRPTTPPPVESSLNQMGIRNIPTTSVTIIPPQASNLGTQQTQLLAQHWTHSLPGNPQTPPRQRTSGPGENPLATPTSGIETPQAKK